MVSMVDLIPAILVVAALVVDLVVFLKFGSVGAKATRTGSAALATLVICLAGSPFVAIALLPLDLDVADFYAMWRLPVVILLALGAVTAIWRIASTNSKAARLL
ncbi:hypothetical protein H8R18_06200 [Nanchangia anserum]|uniref:Uncharacterized protein n=1 Tax=Nanchangia anserum TaxID=2692125 RepID=A0A8I0GBI4_9ACTO|nr:hypothetical protein [Nanchangia anserum]MBD3689125.1 hypothetical protein [Nanchangia anserum]QOX81359.1 hypothetical protein H8R18_06200 [Nanchangia anserum]